MTRKSICGYLVKLAATPISWKTKKQPTVSGSSAEAECLVMANTTSEIVWICNLLHSFCIFVSPACLYYGNQVALHIANNHVFHEYTKNIDVDCHFIREHIMSCVIAPQYTSTHKQLADIFTKALGH